MNHVGVARLVLASLIVVGLAGCSSHTSTTTTTTAPSPTSRRATTTPAAQPPSFTEPCGHPGAPPATYDHVIWIWMENHPYDKVIGSRDAPATSALAERCATATDYRTVGRPSLPNYIGATSGDTHGITDDGSPSVHRITSDNLFRQVRASGGSERSYEEDMPAPCALSSAGRYAVKHNPAAYYRGATDRQACRRDDVPLGTSTSGPFATGLESGHLPVFTFVTPNLCNDTHDCAVADGDAWLGRWMKVILNSPTYRDGRTAVFVVWDEPTPMPDLVISPTTPAGARFDAPVDHYALLRTTEELLGLPRHLGAAATSPSLRRPFRL
ncbi:MAG: hypothetical protein JO291_16540 [Acidimicrobiia bacterium]|nr:hypothetical protein [Acidimicrobiia bacterium]